MRTPPVQKQQTQPQPRSVPSTVYPVLGAGHCDSSQRAWGWGVITIPPAFFSRAIYFSARKECGEFTTGLWPLLLAAGRLFPKREAAETDG